MKIEKQKYRALVDTGAEVSLMHRRIYDNFKVKPKLQNKKALLQSVNGETLQVDGAVEMSFEIGGLTMSHLFYVVRNMNRNLILGRDWLLKNGVRLYFDLGCIRVHQTYIPLQEDIHVSSVVRAHNKTKIKPQTAVICRCKVRDSPDLPVNKQYEISPIEIGFLSYEPGLMVSNSVCKLNGNRFIPVLVVNNTNKTFTIRKGCPLAKIEQVQGQTIMSVNDVSKLQASEGHLVETFEDLDVPEKHKKRVLDLILRNKDLFANKDSELSHTDTVKMKIDTGDHNPMKLRPYRTPLNNRKVIDNAIDEKKKKKIIERSKSPWSFPVVIVDKKDGSKRFCVDFRALNKVTKANSYPLPLIDDILALLGHAKYFTLLDLKSGYWQVCVDDECKEKTAFACHRGLFQFNVMPFGLTTAPAVFQELMSHVLEGLDRFTVAYLDDILIFSRTLEEHLTHIQNVFDRLRKHSLRLKLKKCSFLKSETNYLGFVINDNGIKPEEKKVNVIKSLPTPQTVRDVRSFIGMCSYYRRFIPHFSAIAEPLIALTRKYAKFKWNPKCQSAFDSLKNSLAAFPMLGYPDPNKPYVLYTDASNDCIGACLTQPNDDFAGRDPELKNEKPIYYLSHRLSDTQTRWSTIEKEAFAIHFALQKLDHYLHNAQFVIKTDHKPLKYILDTPNLQNKKLQLWSLGIAGYNCKVEYLKGSENTCADLLSRLQQNVGLSQEEDSAYEPEINANTYEIGAMNSNKFQPKDYARCNYKPPDSLEKPTLGDDIDIVIEQSKDDDLMTVKLSLQNDKASKTVQQKHIIIDNVLYYISDVDSNPTLRLYVPKHLKDHVIDQYHDLNGHMGIDKTFEAIKTKYYWPNLYKELYEYVSHCITCQVRGKQAQKPPLQMTDTPPYAFAKIGLDLSGPYPTSLSGNRYIVGFIDLYSGYPEAFAVPDKSADNIAQLLIDEIFPRYGSVLEIVTDNGSENVNRVMRETLEALNINHVRTSIYHPQSNSKIEKFHATLHDILSKKLKDDLSTWDLYLNQTLAAIRFNVNESTKFSPFFLLFNRDVVLPLDNILKPRPKYAGEDVHRIALEQQHKSFVLVQNRLRQAKRRYAKYADRNAKDVKFDIGDPVYYKVHHKSNKLNLDWKPYFRILEKTSPVTYVLKNQLDGSTVRVNARDIRKAHVDDWKIPPVQGRVLRKTNYVVPPAYDTSESETSSDGEKAPLARIADRYRKERDDSDQEDNIPLMELAKRLKSNTQQTNEDESAHSALQSDLESEEGMSENSYESSASIDEHNMLVD
ncbi:MAG: DDE-type integrase/transposase/recombinase [Candidatus Thiodiazotropha taylori]|nr:DDE-type integrase/transposase/recombinase [Candidatus Thiodiazotropha taylori]MCW4310873.1 reverse transcriptase domain-containing protein [Candidatus Thiodiazotropha endolucinida]